MKRQYLITNIGCDDENEFVLFLSDEDLKIIMYFINENNLQILSSCCPRISIKLIEEGEENE